MQNTHHSETWSALLELKPKEFQQEVYYTISDLMQKAFFDLSEEDFRTYDIEVDVMTMGTVVTVSLRMWGGYDRNEQPPRKEKANGKVNAGPRTTGTSDGSGEAAQDS